MYIGLGTIVIIVIIVLVLLMLRRRLCLLAPDSHFTAGIHTRLASSTWTDGAYGG